MRRAIFCLPALVAVAIAHARLSVDWSYQRLFDTADLVVVAVVVSTTDTAERAILPDIRPDVHVVGMATGFYVGGVLKGDHNLKTFVLHHYRLENPASVLLNGPTLISFDPKAHAHFLLFLVRETDGTYAPIAGQVDAAKSIFRLESGFPPFVP
jgi:hypothetical protein